MKNSTKDNLKCFVTSCTVAVPISVTMFCVLDWLVYLFA